MAPTLEDGDFVVALSACLAGRPRCGDIVLARHPELGLVVKRVRSVDPTGAVSLAGDSPWSRASELLGTIAAGALQGRAVLRVARPPRGLSWLARQG
jgi:hypothetical protein